MSISPPDPAQRVLVCGGRDYDNQARVFEWLDSLRLRPYRDLIIEGGCRRQHMRGADFFAHQYAELRRISVITIWANWDDGQSAGPQRNREMLKWEPTTVISFPGGRGTASMVWLARGKRIPVIEVPE